MHLYTKLDQIHSQARQNKWLWYFSIFCRLVLALGFIPAGITKIMGERFAGGLSVNHPMGHYLEALHHTGYYYTTIGIVQLAAAILLLIPRTVTLGALLYLPVIVNICILSFAVRFEGSHVTAPLMVPANQYIFFRNYDRVKFILPFKKFTPDPLLTKPGKYSNKFLTLFFAGVFASVGIVILYFIYGHKVMPRNSFRDCETQFKATVTEAAGRQLCECIHTQGRYINECPEEFEKLKK